jgi:predicted NAD/FAD-dependent oxidoreductase
MRWAWRDFELKQGQTVTDIQGSAGSYTLTSTDSNGDSHLWSDFEAVVVAIPAPQAHTLLAPHFSEGDDLSDLAQLEAVYDPIVTAMVQTTNPVEADSMWCVGFPLHVAFYVRCLQRCLTLTIMVALPRSRSVQATSPIKFKK